MLDNTEIEALKQQNEILKNEVDMLRELLTMATFQYLAASDKLITVEAQTFYNILHVNRLN